MFRALQLFVSPGGTWAKIGAAKRGVLWNLLIELLPLLLVVGVIEGYGLMSWGGKTGQYNRIVQLAFGAILKIEAVRVVIGIIMVFTAAQILRWIGDSFDFHPPFRACFVLAVFGFSPYFILRLGLCLPGLNEWVGPALGVLGCVFVLYQGVGAALEPDQTKGFGLYLLSILVFAMLCFVDQLLLLMILQGKIPV